MKPTTRSASLHMEKTMPFQKNQAPGQAPDPAARAKVAYQAIATMLVQGGLPPDAVEHLRAAHESILAHATSAATPNDGSAGGLPLGESVAASKRREAGEDPEDRDDEDPDGDDAPADKMKGGKKNPLSAVKRWASAPAKDDEPEPAKPKPKAAGTLAKGKPRFVRR